MVDPLATDAPLTPAALYIKATIFVSAASCPVTVQDTVLVCGIKPTATVVGATMIDAAVVAFGVGIKAGVSMLGMVADISHEGISVCQCSDGVAVKVAVALWSTHAFIVVGAGEGTVTGVVGHVKVNVPVVAAEVTLECTIC